MKKLFLVAAMSAGVFAASGIKLNSPEKKICAGCVVALGVDAAALAIEAALNKEQRAVIGDLYKAYFGLFTSNYKENYEFLINAFKGEHKRLALEVGASLGFTAAFLGTAFEGKMRNLYWKRKIKKDKEKQN
jgi:hypothetical protein